MKTFGFLLLIFAFLVFVFVRLVGTRQETAAVVLEDGTRLIVETAKTPFAKTRGLSGRNKIPGDGMLFVYDPPQDAGIWMKDMNFPIDIAWIADGRVAYVVENALPDNSSNREIYRTGEPVEYVLELPSGTLDRLGIKSGDAIRTIEPFN